MNATTAPYEADKILGEIPDRISDIVKPFARQTPHHPALVQGDVTWTYGDLATIGSLGQRSLLRITACDPATGS
jgi:hypothetical protein